MSWALPTSTTKPIIVPTISQKKTLPSHLCPWNLKKIWRRTWILQSTKQRHKIRNVVQIFVCTFRNSPFHLRFVGVFRATRPGHCFKYPSFGSAALLSTLPDCFIVQKAGQNISVAVEDVLILFVSSFVENLFSFKDMTWSHCDRAV